ncbi:MAG: RNA 2'-phosphotransferase [Thermoplasmatales archaeon]|nr:RNA 2'-phosphotransferase [Thermoplasmatales archaeon]
MIGICEQHGFYRGEECPSCKKKGKFLMNDKEARKLSSLMVGILRHFPQNFDLELDKNGWIEIERMADAIKDKVEGFYWVRRKHIEAVATTDEKGRYQIKNGRIRATYAHTIDVDLSDLPDADVDELYYPVTEEEAEIVLEQGLFPVDRKKVHLSGSIEKAVEAGKRRCENPVILKIDVKKMLEDGFNIKKAGNEVYIADKIDGKYISRLN